MKDPAFTIVKIGITLTLAVACIAALAASTVASALNRGLRRLAGMG